MSTEELIKEVSVKHGIALGRDDPILILHTINTKLIEETAKAQQAMLDQYKEVLEEVLLHWGNETKEKSERILNTSLAASKEVMTNSSEEFVKEIVQSTKKELEMSLTCISQSLRKTERVAFFNVTASIITFLTVCLAVLCGFL
jgi:hypothetical protein